MLKAIEFAQNTGASVNIDLMSGLAGETPETWDYSVKRALETGVESITIYKMELYANTQYYKDVRKNTIVLPSDEQELEFMQHALNKFGQSEYEPWCFFTFTKNGEFVHVHAPSIWRGDDYYPFGASAFGRLGDWVFQSTNEVDKYVSIVGEDKLPITRGHNMTSLDKIIRDIVLGMKLIRLDLKVFQSRYGFKLSAFCSEIMQQLESEDFITFNDDEVVLTQKGMLHGDFVGKSLSKPLMNMY